jgi:hypothetical protein
MASNATQIRRVQKSVLLTTLKSQNMHRQQNCTVKSQRQGYETKFD